MDRKLMIALCTFVLLCAIPMSAADQKTFATAADAAAALYKASADANQDEIVAVLGQERE